MSQAEAVHGGNRLSELSANPVRIYLTLAALSAAFSALLTPLVRRIATRLGAIDRPSERRVHEIPLPRLGGLAIAGAGLAALSSSRLLGFDAVAALHQGGWALGWLLAGSAIVLLTGVLDDVRGLGAFPKLVLVTAAAAVALGGGYALEGFTEPFTSVYVHFGPLGAVVTLIWIVLLTNAFNLVDGLDGLAAGVALIASGTLLAVSLLEGRSEAALMWSVLFGAMAGFLPYNFFPASIFLGDSGSLLLGYLLAVFAVESLEKGATLLIVLAPVLALGLPVLEIVLTVARRTRARGARSVFHADRDHIHHRLLERGLSHRGAVLTLYAACVILSVVAIVAVLAQGVTTGVVVLVASVAMYSAIRWLHPRGSPRRRH